MYSITDTLHFLFVYNYANNSEHRKGFFTSSITCWKTISSGYVQSTNCTLLLLSYALINSKLQPPPPISKAWAFELSAPLGQNGVQMPYLIVGFEGFVCHTPLKNNRRRLLPSLIKTFRRPFLEANRSQMLHLFL